MTDKESSTEKIETEEAPAAGPFDALDELRREIDRRIRDNKRFLERFLDEDFEDDDEGDEGDVEWHEEEEL